MKTDVKSGRKPVAVIKGNELIRRDDLACINLNSEEIASECRVLAVKIEGKSVNAEQIEVHIFYSAGFSQLIFLPSVELSSKTKDYFLNSFNRHSGFRFVKALGEVTLEFVSQVRLLGSMLNKDVVPVGCGDESVRGSLSDFVRRNDRTDGVDESESFLREVRVRQFLELAAVHLNEGLLDLVNL